MGRKRFDFKVAHQAFDSLIPLHRKQAAAGLLLKQDVATVHGDGVLQTCLSA